MKKIYFFILVVFPLLIVLLLLLNLILPGRKYQGYKTVDYQLKGKKYRLLVADTRQKWERGLMNFKKLDGVQGMIFIFPDKQLRHFWNKNTYLDLDVYWLADDKIVGKDFLPSIDKSKQLVIINSKAKVNKVIEIVR